MTSERRFPKSVQPGKPQLANPKPGWKRYAIGDLFEVVSRPVDLKDDEQYDLVTARRSRGGIDHRSRLFGREISVKSQFRIHEGDFLISKRQIVHGACGFVPARLDGAIVSNEYSVLRCRAAIDPEYLAQLVHSIYLQQTFFHSSIGVHIEKMIFKLEDWFKWPINLPDESEQNRIAKFLSEADRKTTLLEENIVLLKEYKKGCLQRLFAQEIRFKDDEGRDFPEWQEKRLGEFAEVNPRATDLPERFFYVDLESVSNGTLKSPKEISRDLAPSRAQRVLSKGDVLFQMVRPYQRNNLLFELDGDYVASTGYAQIRANEVSGFLFQQMHTDLFVNDVLRRCTGTSYPAISSSDLAEIKVLVPRSTTEQRKISEFLYAIDAKSQLLFQQTLEMKRFKKGLLQMMFG